MELIGLYFVAAALLVVAGGAKAIRPEDTARALIRLIPPRPRATMTSQAIRPAVRVSATLEAALGVIALLYPRPASASLVAASYVVFAGVVLYARSTGGVLSSCGCFGRADTPPTALHALVDLAFALSCVAVAANAPSDGTLIMILHRQPAAGIPLIFVSAVGLYLAYLVLAHLPRLEGMRRLVGRHPEPAAAGSTA
jgi:hypothetical protein